MIKISLITAVFLSGAMIASAAGEISKFSFTTEPQTVKPGEVSQKITIQAQDAGGNPAELSQTGCLMLETTSATGEFSSNNENWKAVSSLTMNKGTANRSFYYKDTAAGSYVLTAKAALVSCSAWTAENWTAAQNVLVSASQNFSSVSSSQAGSQNQSDANAVNTNNWPVEPQIYADAGEDKTAIAGADVIFSGEALGLKKEPMENARYLWNFGDGSSAEGKNVRHSYKYPGNYIAVLDVSSGQYSVSDRLNVKIIPNELIIVEANSDFIKLKNKSNLTLDISGWFLTGDGVVFKFPASFFIAGGSELIISADISKIKIQNGYTVDLLYPNGSVAFSYKKEIKTPSEPTTVVGSDGVAVQSKIVPVKTITTNSSNSSSLKNLPLTKLSKQNQQTANVVYTASATKSNWQKWLYLALGLGVFGGSGLFFIRRNGGV